MVFPQILSDIGYHYFLTSGYGDIRITPCVISSNNILGGSRLENGSSPSKSTFQEVLNHLPGFKNYTFFDFKKTIFSLHPNEEVKINNLKELSDRFKEVADGCNLQHRTVLRVLMARFIAALVDSAFCPVDLKGASEYVTSKGNLLYVNQTRPIYLVPVVRNTFHKLFCHKSVSQYIIERLCLKHSNKILLLIKT